MRTEPVKKLFTAELQQLQKMGLDVGQPASSQAVSVDNGEVLKAIALLREDLHLLARSVAPELILDEARAAEEAERAARQKEFYVTESEYKKRVNELNMLKTELKIFSTSIEQTKQEIAALRPPQSDDDRLIAVTYELDAIVSATENATNTILETAEKIDALSGNVKAQTRDAHVAQLADDISEAVVNIFEACNFQDITGQRITKVVNTLKYVEERVNAMIDIWGEESFVNVQASTTDDRDEDKKLLNGPQLENKGINQDEIDQLFG